MRVRIHRGASQIGGSCVELEHRGARLVLDAGLPLDGEGELPPVPGLATGGSDAPLALLVSHPHRDHWGLVHEVAADVPIRIGEAAARILQEAAFFGAGDLGRTPAGFLADRRTFELGPFTVTPYLVDHSAFDAYALLVEAGGRRLLYTGDWRAHGRKGALIERLIRRPPRPVHALLCEGTHVVPGDTPARTTWSEHDVERALFATLERGRNLALVAFSAQNIDRLVTVYRACRRAGRELVIDLYAHAVARATGRDSIPQAGHPGLRVWLPQAQRVRIKRASAFERLEPVRRCRIHPEEIGARAGELALLFRASMIGDLQRIGGLAEADLVWSQWRGYYDGDPRLQAFAERHGMRVVQHHSSGHATVADLQRLVEALAPDVVVPIHTFAPERFVELLPRVTRQPDGAWWEV